MRYVSQFLHLQRQQKIKFAAIFDSINKNVFGFLTTIKNIGITPDMSAVEKSKLGIFNQLNFFQFVTGILVPVLGLLKADRFPLGGWIIVCLPALVSILVLVLNHYRKHDLALLTYFVLYPFFICFNYINGISLGIELSFILYGILSVFFMKEIGYMVFSISFSMISYFFLSVILKKYVYQLEQINYVAYLLNQGLAIVYIFYGLYLIKTENATYNATLQENAMEMQRQAHQLQQQATELDQLNSLKNKLFSVISHDLKAPMYALRNLFDNIHSQDMPADEIKSLIPEVKQDLNYTVNLMENLLQWAKTQMQSHSVKPQEVNLQEMIDDVVHILHLHAESKNIRITNKATESAHAWVDYDMIHLVLRNLVSNAIKFTPSGGEVCIGANEQNSFTEVYVQDTGRGISAKDLKKINNQKFYTTNGTASEHGTGLGLMLCKEFLAKNDGHLRIESEEGKGSTFSFSLPLS